MKRLLYLFHDTVYNTTMQLSIFSYLIFPGTFHVTGYSWDKIKTITPTLVLRLYCKSLGIDEDIPLYFNGSWDSGMELIVQRQLRQYHFLAQITRKKTWVNVRKKTPVHDVSVSEILVLEGNWEGIPFTCELGIRHLIQFCRLMGVSEIPRDSDILLARLQEEVYYRVYDPPEVFLERLFQQDDPGLQEMVVSLISGDILSLDMFAAFLLEQDQNLAARILKNCSHSVRRELEEKMHTQKVHYSIAWKRISLYMLKRNLVNSGREMTRRFPELSVFHEISLMYIMYRLSQRAQGDHMRKVVGELTVQEKMGSFLAQCRQKEIVSSDIVFPALGLRELYTRYFSETAHIRFDEDREYMQTQDRFDLYRMAYRFIHSMYTYFFQDSRQEQEFEQVVTQRIQSKQVFDLITDEVGIPCFVTAIRDLPRDWMESHLQGVLLLMYRQWKDQQIYLHHLDKWDQKISQKKILQVLQILQYEGRIESALQDQTVMQEPGQDQ